jgi:hypothetical protein
MTSPIIPLAMAVEAGRAVGRILDLVEAHSKTVANNIRLDILWLKEKVCQLESKLDRVEKEKEHWKRLAEQLQETIIKESER